MGVFEAGFVPGCAYLIGSYYKDEEFLRRYAVFMSGAIIAGAFNGLFSYLLSMADGAGGLEGWRWIFIVNLPFIYVHQSSDVTLTLTPRSKAL